MRYVLLACLIALGLTCALSVVVTTADDRELEAFDPFRPATLLPIVANRLHDLRPLVHDLVDAFTAPYRQRLENRATLPADRP
jgi:hypothetical protein